MSNDIVTVSDLIQEVRDLTNEQNAATVGDDAILRHLNRGQRYVTSQLVRASYHEPLISRATLATSGYVAATGIAMPKDAYEDRLLQVYLNTPTVPTLLEQRTYRQVSAFEYNQATATPNMFYIRGRNIVTVPPMTNAYNLLVDYIRQPDRLVKPLGRVGQWDASGGTYVMVEDLDTTQITTTTDQLSSFVNIVDGLTGLVKCTLQVATVSANKLQFRTLPTYTEVYNRTVSASFSALIGTPDMVTADDYVCLASGTCIPQFGNAFLTHLVEYGTAAVNRSLGDTMTQIAAAISKIAEEAAERQQAGRTNTMRVKNRSRVWGRVPTTRFPNSK